MIPRGSCIVSWHNAAMPPPPQSFFGGLRTCLVLRRKHPDTATHDGSYGDLRDSELLARYRFVPDPGENPNHYLPLPWDVVRHGGDAAGSRAERERQAQPSC